MARLAAGDRGILEQIDAAESQAKECLILDSNDFGPIFRSKGTRNLNCRTCGNVLIEGYAEERFVALRLRCFVCANITCTPQSRPLSPFPGTTKIFDGVGIVTVDSEYREVSDDLVLTTKAEYERVKTELSIAPRSSVEHSSILSAIEQIERSLRRLHPKYDKLMSRAARLSVVQDPNCYDGSWPLWAVLQLKNPAPNQSALLPSQQVPVAFDIGPKKPRARRQEQGAMDYLE